ncbi:DUF5676 family membrane protein [Reyranella soli]|uniref:Uncharacterized protein n=1 Tax=Reyranella soli TaxID=1230389 RepID=A0A512NE83_9HYPH|nr:DUF5676 family membrane protein [Reyranella soli]GEP57256.1 hypothetical protein RSO01_44220 [Reyranella soli]
MVVANVHTQSQANGQTPTIRTIPVAVLGMSLSLFLATSFVLCVLGYLLLPGLPVKHEALAIFLPGFELLSWQGFAIGLAESYAWGWYIALLLGTLYNFFARRQMP